MQKIKEEKEAELNLFSKLNNKFAKNTEFRNNNFHEVDLKEIKEQSIALSQFKDAVNETKNQNSKSSVKNVDTESNRNNNKEEYLVFQENINPINNSGSTNNYNSKNNNQPTYSNFKKNPLNSLSNPNLNIFNLNLKKQFQADEVTVIDGKIPAEIEDNHIIILDSNAKNNCKSNTDVNKHNIKFSNFSREISDLKKGKSYAGNRKNKTYYDNMFYGDRPQSLRLSIADLVI